jgi:predicted transcriptional regulator of viral defense system
VIDLGIEVRGKRKQIYEMIKKAKKMSLQEIKASTDINYNTIRSAVIGLRKYGLIEWVERGVYKVKSK